MSKQKRPQSGKLKEISFSELVKGTSSIKDCYRERLGAISRKDDRKLITADDPSKFCGSVDLDNCQTGPRLQDEKRWDYIICYDGKLYFVEIHSAQSSNVSELEGKAKTLKKFLDSEEGLEFRKRKDENIPYIWLVSPKAKVDIRLGSEKLNGDRQSRYLNEKGLKLYKKLSFPLTKK